MIRYAKPATTQQALGLLAERPWRILAGATDVYPALGSRPPRENILDINALDELRFVAETPTHWVIGARATWTDVVQYPLPGAFAALREAAREVGSTQIQNVATVAGNLCNASPAADGVPPLLVLDAEIELRSVAGARFLPLGEFILGNRRTALGQGEMMTAIRIAKSSATGRAAFVKLGARRYLVISIAMAAARLVVEQGRIAQAAIAVGACSSVAVRLRGVEAALRGLPVHCEMAAAIGATSMDELSPIDDVRASSTYRLEAAREIVIRAVARAAGIADGGKAAA